MRSGARRLPSRLCGASARRARLAACLWLGALVASPAAAEITGARYGDPTTRYAHGVLGDAIEYGALELDLSDGRRLRMVLPETLVFEDIAPRLADLDGDGDAEVITVESSLTLGGRLAIYDETGRIATTEHIGRRNRWLAPVGAADLDGDGTVEIAFVNKPHLAKELMIYTYLPGEGLRLRSSLSPLTNHRIGEDFISGGIRDCGGGPEMILASGDWRRLMAVTWDGAARPVARDIGPNTGRAAFAAALACGAP